MDKSRYQLRPGLWLDCRRAAFLEQEAALVIADLHLGYTWAHRFNGQMLPLASHNRVGERLASLLDAYSPKQVIFLGDILHQAVPVKAIEAEVTELLDTLHGRAELILIQGNHDRQLAKLPWASRWVLHSQFRLGSVALLHGDKLLESPSDATFSIIGHEHPAIHLGDGVTTSAKFPCFLASEKLLVLPAFSLWAAGTPYGSYEMISPLARQTRFHLAVALMGNKLLPVPLTG